MASRGRVLVTRASDQGAELIKALEARGFVASCWPVLRVTAAADNGQALKQAIATGFDRLVLSSSNGLRACLAAGLDCKTAPPVAAIGQETARICRDSGLTVDLVPRVADGGKLVDLIRQHCPLSETLLLPQAHNARPALAEGLQSAGFQVQVVEAYRTADHTHPTPPPTQDVVAISLASSATVERFCRLAGADCIAAYRQAGVLWAAIGAQTASACRQQALTPLVCADEATSESLAAVIDRSLTKQ